MGFEPTDALTRHSISNAASSTTRPPLHIKFLVALSQPLKDYSISLNKSQSFFHGKYYFFTLSAKAAFLFLLPALPKWLQAYLQAAQTQRRKQPTPLHYNYLRWHKPQLQWKLQIHMHSYSHSLVIIIFIFPAAKNKRFI